MTELYENLLKATDNTNDITNEKYAVISKIDGLLCSVKEEDTGLEHSNVPILNGVDLKTGDKVIIGFINNSIYNVVCYGALDRTLDINSENVIEHSALSNLGLSANSTQSTINSSIDTALSNKISKSQTVGLVKNDGTIDTNTYLTSSAISGMLTTSDIADNLTTNDSTKVLSAKQGKILNDMIGSAISYIVGSGS